MGTMRALLKAALFGVPQPMRRVMKAVVPDRLFQVTAKIVAPPVQDPLPAEVAKEPPPKEIARLLFDAPWYVSQHPEAPDDPDEAYSYYLANGRMAGHRPSPLF